jgi:hypothetical protein
LAPDPQALLEQAAAAVHGPVHEGIARAMSLKPGTPAWKAADLLGNGQRVRASDTVLFALWSAAHDLDDLPGALWTTAEGLGDVDTTGAITAGSSPLAPDLPVSRARGSTCANRSRTGRTH